MLSEPSLTSNVHPGKIALKEGAKEIAYGELDRRAERVAVALHRLGTARGDRIALFLENSIEWVVAALGVWRANAVLVPIQSASTPRKLGAILRDSRAELLIADPKLSRTVAGAVPTSGLRSIIWSAPPPDGSSAGPTLAKIMESPEGAAPRPAAGPCAVSAVIYTASASGAWVGATHSRRSLAAGASQMSAFLELSSAEVLLLVLPLASHEGLLALLGALGLGATLVIERSFGYPYQTLLRIAQHRVTGIPATPAVLSTILSVAPFEGVDLGSLRWMSSSGAPFFPTVAARLKHLLGSVRISAAYGVPEAGWVAGHPSVEGAEHEPLSAVGELLPGVRARIVDGSGATVPDGEIGELVVESESAMIGYWGSAPARGGVPTGDMFRRDAGRLHFVGRRDGLLEVRGRKVSPREIEGALLELPDVLTATVIGVPDPIEGCSIRARIVSRQGRRLDDRELRRHCLAEIEPDLVPKQFEIAEARA
jgi:acyl-CoA synthetase (AMP-forming)/AMP-acid ligase II